MLEIPKNHKEWAVFRTKMAGNLLATKIYFYIAVDASHALGLHLGEFYPQYSITKFVIRPYKHTSYVGNQSIFQLCYYDLVNENKYHQDYWTIDLKEHIDKDLYEEKYKIKNIQVGNYNQSRLD